MPLLDDERAVEREGQLEGRAEESQDREEGEAGGDWARPGGRAGPGLDDTEAAGGDEAEGDGVPDEVLDEREPVAVAGVGERLRHVVFGHPERAAGDGEPPEVGRVAAVRDVERRLRGEPRQAQADVEAEERVHGRAYRARPGRGADQGAQARPGGISRGAMGEADGTTPAATISISICPTW
ncbi:MAG: hypothetical protein U0599_25155 [Vicinamibacteria bacterium]